MMMRVGKHQITFEPYSFRIGMAFMTLGATMLWGSKGLPGVVDYVSGLAMGAVIILAWLDRK